uniref:Uncharacterized protein n=1 Tax=Ciona savignyi TaxID=51511 RepID=H2YC89_CIOSA
MIYVPIYSLWIITLYSMLLYEGIATNQRISFTETDKSERRHIGRLLRSVTTVEQYSWTEWSPALNFTCKNGEITFYHSECSAGSGVVEQSRSCVDTVTNTNAFDPSNGQQCATEGNTAGSTRQINCNTPQVCADWSNWGPCVNCVNGNCTNLNAKEKTGQTRRRECQQEFRTDEECSKQWQLGLCVKRSTGSGLVPDVRNAGGGVSSEGVTPVDAFSGSAKIAAFCIAGVVMVGLLGFAGSRFLRTAMQRPRPREPVEM